MPISQKMRVAAKKVLEGKPKGQALREAGYAESTSLVPKAITGSDGWQELMEELLPDEDLGAAHKKLLEKKEVVVINLGDKQGSEFRFTGQIHSDAARALDMAYKLKSRYAPTKVQITDEYDEFSDEELEAELLRKRERRSAGKGFKASAKG